MPRSEEEPGGRKNNVKLSFTTSSHICGETTHVWLQYERDLLKRNVLRTGDSITKIYIRNV